MRIQGQHRPSTYITRTSTMCTRGGLTTDEASHILILFKYKKEARPFLACPETLRERMAKEENNPGLKAEVVRI